MSKGILAALALATLATACVVPVDSQEDEQVGTDEAALVDVRNPTPQYVSTCDLVIRMTPDGHYKITPVPCERVPDLYLGDPWEQVEQPTTGP